MDSGVIQSSHEHAQRAAVLAVAVVELAAACGHRLGGPLAFTASEPGLQGCNRASAQPEVHGIVDQLVCRKDVQQVVVGVPVAVSAL